MALKTLQALIFLGVFATSCLAQAPAPAPMTLLPPVESPSPVITPTAQPPSPVASPPVPVASPPVPVNEPTPVPTTPPTVSPPTISPTTPPMASPPKPDGMAPGPSGPTPAPAPGPDAPEADSALTNKAFLVSTVIAGALYAVVLA
ncbi:PREDICTED: classical arabinogalactan protein 3-like [Camelina sativa]|uniref:Classical arabinogalactan protein 3-like n=1 Tax=Camelina sativa TaxID=90675 RepID=A0ABM0UUJ2_CAMSA|nr:PREDICTED: classical arabinogalactan protein 3-like [Camelina sativa]